MKRGREETRGVQVGGLPRGKCQGELTGIAKKTPAEGGTSFATDRYEWQSEKQA